jgi:hypothetical protein
MSDLREKLATAVIRHIDEEGASFDVVEIDDVVWVVAAWLRDEAAPRRPGSTRCRSGRYAGEQTPKGDTP